MLEGAALLESLSPVMPNKSRTVRSYWTLFRRGICEVAAIAWVQSGLVLGGMPELPGVPESPPPAVEPTPPGLFVEPGPEGPEGTSMVPVVHAAARAAATSNPLRE